MKVKDLIKKLQEFDPEDIVHYRNWDYPNDFIEVDTVENTDRVYKSRWGLDDIVISGVFIQ